MITPPPPDRPNFTLAEGFTLPELDAEAMRIANEVFSIQHYASAPLIGPETREVVFGHPYPQRPVGGFVCNGFVINTLERTEEGIIADTIVAPSPKMSEVAFLKLCLELSEVAQPESDFDERATPLRDIVVALGRTGIPAATGVHIGVDLHNPATAFASLIVPRIYITEFGPKQSVDNPNQYAVNTCAALFRYLTTQQVRGLEGNS